jgi:hypothetical protein
MFKTIVLLLLLLLCVFRTIQSKTQYCATIDKDETGMLSIYLLRKYSHYDYIIHLCIYVSICLTMHLYLYVSHFISNI